MKSNWDTRLSLIQRAKCQDDEDAWDEFVHCYKPFIYYFLKSYDVPLNDSDDLVQEILLKLWKNLQKYETGGAKFRTWLSTVIRNETISYFRHQAAAKNSAVFTSDKLEFLSPFEMPDIDEKVEQEWKNYIAKMAFERIEKTYKGQAFEVFQLSLKGYSQEEIVEKTGLTGNSIHTLKSRVKQSFTREVRRLVADLEF